MKRVATDIFSYLTVQHKERERGLTLKLAFIQTPFNLQKKRSGMSQDIVVLERSV